MVDAHSNLDVTDWKLCMIKCGGVYLKDSFFSLT